MPHRISIRVSGKWVSPITATVREVGATSGSLMDIETLLAGFVDFVIWHKRSKC